ncbi:hypothetical protein KC333_g2334 [Hortaea werneckii]|nr:hypothetical protein KC333_g2334 [Hortaea werneckii]KAI7321203.1 hypothetical protein KC326_g2366 [Hortaea werneckii]
MQYTTGFVLAVAGLAAAQSSSTAAAGVTSVSSASTSSSTSESGCGKSIDLIIQTCLGSTQAQLAACEDNDWDCLCTQQTNVLTCYNNCPSDPNAFGAQQTQTSYCNAAKAYGSSSSSSSRTVSATASVSSLSEAIASKSTALAAVSSDGTASSTAESTSSGSASGSAATASETDSGAIAFTPAGGLVAAIFGLAALI